MSYDFPSTPNPKRRGGGGMFFLIILAIGGFLIFSNMNRGGDPAGGGAVAEPPPQGNRNIPTDEDEYRAEREHVLGEENKTARKKMPTTGGSGAANDWKMQDAGASENPPSANSKTKNGDWAIEDVDGIDKKNNQFKFSNKPGQEAPKSGGDWSIEDVKPSKKTQKGDWAIEDAGTKKK